MIDVDTGSFFAIMVAAALAAVTVTVLPGRFAPPVVVIELLLGIVIGPEVLDLAAQRRFHRLLLEPRARHAVLLRRLRDRLRAHSRPAACAGRRGWLISLALAYGIGGVLAAAGIILSLLYTGSALATTAIGTLIPILRDNRELDTRFGSYLLAAGAVGEFGPILLVTLVLSTTNPLHEAAILVAFIVLAIVLAIASMRLAWRGFPALERTLESSSQLAIRIAVLLVFGLLFLAGELGLDILLGGFVAGMITRAAFRGREVTVFESKLTAVGFGFLIPFFFIESGIEFDLDALGSASALLKLAPLLRALPGHPGPPGDAALPAPPRSARPHRSGVLLRHRAAAGGGDHDDRHGDGAYAHLDRRRAGRRRDAVNAGLPVRRAGASQGGGRRTGSMSREPLSG